MRERRSPTVRVLLSGQESAVLALGRPGDASFHRNLIPVLPFSVVETTDYVYESMRLAGCGEPSAVIDKEIMTELHALTGGRAGRLNQLCVAAMARAAQKKKRSHGLPPVSSALVAAEARKLGMKTNGTSESEFGITVEALTLSDLTTQAFASVVITTGGRIIGQVLLDRSRIVIRRDPHSDIAFDSKFVSRYQNLIISTGEGSVLIDLNSTNGTFVNAKRVREHLLIDGDLIAIGKYQLKFVDAVALGAPPGMPEPKFMATDVLPSDSDNVKALPRSGDTLPPTPTDKTGDVA